MKFYRVRSRVPTIKPSLVIGPSLPATGSFLETHSDLVRSRRRVRELLADARIAHPFGEHAVQTIDVDPGVAVAVEGGGLVALPASPVDKARPAAPPESASPS